MDATKTPPAGPSIPIRSPAFTPPTPVVTESPEPSWTQPPPPRFLHSDEQVELSIKPATLAFFSVPGLVASALSVLALALDLVWAPNGGDSPLFPGLIGVFLLAYVVSVVFWAWLLGLGYLVVLPLSYFFGSYAVILSTPPATGAPSGAHALESPDPWVLLLFVVALEILIPVVLGLIAWARSFYIVTTRRAIEVWGYWSPTARELPLERITSVQTSVSALASRLGYGTVLLRTVSPKGQERFGGVHLTVRRGNLGLAFFGVRRPVALAREIQRRIESAPGSSETAPAPP